MTPIYFPFTFIPAPVAQALGVFFKQTAAYQPSGERTPDAMRKMADRGLLDVRVPAAENIPHLDAVIRDFAQWAEHRRGSELSYFKVAGSVPYYDETMTHEIRSDIRRPDREKAATAADPLVNARLFLHMAQDFDVQNWEIMDELDALKQKEASFINALKGGEEDDAEPTLLNQALTPEDPGNYMIEERMNAWVRLLLLDPRRSGLFVCGNRTAFDHAAEPAGPGAPVISLKGVPLDGMTDDAVEKMQGLLASHLEEIMRNGGVAPETEDVFELQPPDAGGRKASLDIYLIPDQPPDMYFRQFIKGPELVKQVKSDASAGHVMLGLLDVNTKQA